MRDTWGGMLRTQAFWTLLILACLGGSVEAASRCAPNAVPAGGCTTTHASVQAAITAAGAGDTVYLHPQTYVESVGLPDKGTLSAPITITTDAAASSLPAAGVRTSPIYAPFLPKIKSPGGGEPAVYTAAGARHYTFRHIEFPGVPSGFNDIMRLGIGDSGQQFETQEPSFITVDQCYFHGDPVAGQKRAIGVNGKNLTITNSYFADIKAEGEDSQCIAGWNGHGPLTILNNFMECGTENFIIGGADPWVRTYMSITGSTTTTSAAVATTEAGHTLAELSVGQVVAIRRTSTATVEYATIASVTGTGATGSISWTPAVSAVPNTTGSLRAGVVLDGLTFCFNHLVKNPAWMDGVLARPVMTSAVASSGGTLTGTYYYKAQAFNPDGYNDAYAYGYISDNEVSATASNQKITVMFPGVTGATIYRLWRGGSSNGQDEWVDCTASPCVDDGSLSWSSSATFSGQTWVVKNLFELKAVTNAQVDSNIFEYQWRGADVGYAVWIKSVNQDGGCWFCGSAHIVIEKNIWRHIDGWLTLNGQESEHGPKPPPLTDAIFRNNLVYDSTSTWSQGENPYAMLATNNVVGLVLDHNTVVHTMTGLLLVDGTVSPAPTITNNMFRRQDFGIHSSTGEGTQALADFMTGYTFAKNAVADAASSSYPTNNTYENSATWQGEFIAYSATGVGANYAIRSDSALKNAGLDGKDVGVDVPLVLAATADVVAGAPTTSSGTYYVATNQAGASNTLCDGLSPVDAGGGRCPFKDFNSATVRAILLDGVNVRMEVRAGTYVLDGLENAIVVQGAGTSFSQATTLVAYTGEAPIFDGSNTTREVIRVTGTYVVIQGLTLQNAGAYNIEIRGGCHVHLYNNTLLQNFSSDSLKGDGGACDVEVMGNTLRHWSSQAVDLAGVSDWLIIRNHFSQPGGSGTAKCIGQKFETVNVRVVANIFEGCGGVAMGGISSDHLGAYEASGLTVEGNVFINGTGFVFDAYSCLNCIFRNNQIYGSAYGGRLSGIATQGESGCNDGAGSCTPTTNFIDTGNVYRSLVGASGNPKNIYWAVDTTELSAFSAGTNTYCLAAGDSTDRFAIDGAVTNFAAWKTAVSSDTTSAVAGTTTGQCLARLRGVRIR